MLTTRLFPYSSRARLHAAMKINSSSKTRYQLQQKNPISATSITQRRGSSEETDNPYNTNVFHSFKSNRFFSSAEHNHPHQHRVKGDWPREEDFFTRLQRQSLLFKARMTQKQQITFTLPKVLTIFFQYLRELNQQQKQQNQQKATEADASNSFHFKKEPPSVGAQMNESIVKFLDEAKIKYDVKDQPITTITTTTTSSHTPPTSITEKRKTISFPFTFSDLAGHGSFLFLALSYLENDFLHLRLYAFSGICFSIIFQYYREKPLWIPIRWNSIFLLINAIMIMALLKEEDDARNIPDEQKLLFQNVFEKRGMKPVDYLHLISVAKRLEFKKGDKLVDETKKNTRVYLVKSGRCSVTKNGQKVGNIARHQFVGAMSFLTWEGSLSTAEQLDQVSQEKSTSANGSQNRQTERKAGGVTSLLLDMVPDDFETASIVQAAVEEETAVENKKVALNKTTITKNEENAVMPITTPLGPSTSTETPKDEISDRSFLDYTSAVWKQAVENLQDALPNSKEEDRNANRSQSTAVSDSTVNTPQQGLTIDTAFSIQTTKENVKSPDSPSKASEEGHLGRADVVAEEDCIVFSWKFKDLHNLIMQNPSLGLVFERCLSEDLNKKMSTSWEEEIKLRYKQIVLGALMDGEINEKERNVLEKFRTEYHITSDDHERILREFDWSVDEYDSGYKSGQANGAQQQYIEILNQQLNQSEGLSNEKRTYLREYRMKNGINSDAHLAALKKIGWTLDDYEVGKKGVSRSIANTNSENEQRVTNNEDPSFGEVAKRRPVLTWFRNQMEKEKLATQAVTNPSASSPKTKTKKQSTDTEYDNPFLAHVVDVDHLMDPFGRQ